MIKALSIDASDPSSGAGMQSNLAVFNSLRVYGLSIITALTIQNTQGVIKVIGLDKHVIEEQIKAVLSDTSIDAVKIGMVYDSNAIDAITSSLKVKAPIVIDPVLRSSTGVRLFKDSYDEYKRLLKLAYAITPNIYEAESLSGIRIDNIDDAKEAARILSSYARNIIITGGHMSSKAIDILYANDQFYMFEHEKVNASIHGSGSVFSAVLTAELAKGFDIVKATELASKYTLYGIRDAVKIGRGMLIPTLNNYANKEAIELEQAIDIIQAIDGFAKLIPETQSNFVYAKDNKLYGVKGRIVKFGSRAKANAIALNASRHVADALRVMMHYNPSMRSAINIRYDDKIIDIAKRLNLKVAYYDRSKEPKDVKEKEGASIRWGIEQVAREGEYDMVYHKGDLGKEPMIIIFGRDPMDVIDKLCLLIRQIDPNS